MENLPIEPQVPSVPEPAAALPPEPPMPAPPQATAMAPLAPTAFGFGSLLRRAWSIWRIQWFRALGLVIRSLLVGGLVFLVPIAMYAASSFMLNSYMAAGEGASSGATSLVSGPPAWLLIMRSAAGLVSVLGVFVFFFIQIRYGIAYLYLIAGADERRTVKESLRRVKGRFWSVLLVILLTVLASSGAMLLFFVPWLIWLPTFMMVHWVFVIEGRKGLDVLVQARRWVKGDGFKVFLYFFAFGLLSFGLSAVFSFAGAFFKNAYAFAIAGVLSAVFSIVFIAPFQTAFWFATYEALRAKKGETPPELPNQRKWFIVAMIFGLLAIPAMAFGGYLTARWTALRPVGTYNGTDKETNAKELAAYRAKIAAENVDTDKDGLPDSLEPAYHADPARPDTDGDGLADGDEVHVFNTDPSIAAAGPGLTYSDGDNLKNGDSPTRPGTKLTVDEIRLYQNRISIYHLHEPTLTTLKGSVLLDANASATSTNAAKANLDATNTAVANANMDPARIDTDNDGLTDSQESQLGTDPNKADTDGDGLADGDETHAFFLKPLLKSSYGSPYSDGDNLKNGYDPMFPGQKLTDDRIKAFLVYIKGRPLHEPTLTTLKGTVFVP